ncbi:substrate-binding periplasmic protein [Aestuariispira insulae]|nr:transporter substrate-binding domain-containing protein [Aestuariispira insulae]
MMIAVAMVVPSQGGAWGQTVFLVTGNEYAPFTDETLPEGGLFTKIVRMIYDRNGEAVEFAFRPWKRGYLETLEGRFEATFPYILTDERAEAFYFSAPVLFVLVQLYTKSDSDFFADEYNDLTGRQTCLPNGYANTTRIERLVEQGRLKRVTATSMASCLRRLAQGRVDFVELNNFVAPTVIRETGLVPGVFRVLELTTDKVGHYVLYPKSGPDAGNKRDRFDAALEEVRKTGELDRLIETYLQGLNPNS